MPQESACAFAFTSHAEQAEPPYICTTAWLLAPSRHSGYRFSHDFSSNVHRSWKVPVNFDLAVYPVHYDFFTPVTCCWSTAGIPLHTGATSTPSWPYHYLWRWNIGRAIWTPSPGSVCFLHTKQRGRIKGQQSVWRAYGRKRSHLSMLGIIRFTIASKVLQQLLSTSIHLRGRPANTGTAKHDQAISLNKPENLNPKRKIWHFLTSQHVANKKSNTPKGAPLKFILVWCIPCYHHLLSQCAGKGERTGHHIRTQGHQEEARGGQPAGRAHPLREEDSGGGSLAFCCQVSPVSAFKQASIFYFTLRSIILLNPELLIKFLFDHSWGPLADCSFSVGQNGRGCQDVWDENLFFSWWNTGAVRFICPVLNHHDPVCGTQSDIKVIFHRETLLPLTSSSRRTLWICFTFLDFYMEVGLGLKSCASFEDLHVSASFIPDCIARLRITNMCTCCWRPVWEEKSGVCWETGTIVAVTFV